MRAPHVYVVGQTASGKTRFSLDFAEDFGLEIINTDSLLFYRDLNIGTAKPSREELALVKHHFVDVCDIGEELTASRFEKLASKTLEDTNKKFLCVGGSGFYIKALDLGLLPLPDTDPKIKAQVLEISDPASELKKVDPNFFDKISPNDLYRVGRALEVYRQTGKPLTLWQKEFNPKPVAKKIAFDWDRSELHKRIKLRTKQMLNLGFVGEVEALLRDNPNILKNWKPISSVGYLQVVQYLNGVIKTLSDLEDEIVLRTVQLSKRQKTWFKKDETVTWFKADDFDKAKDFLKTAFEENLWKA